MTCAACVRTVERAAGRVGSVEEAQVNFASGVLYVTYKGETPDDEGIIAAIKKSGYSAKIYSDRIKHSEEKKYIANLRRKLIKLICLTVPLFIISMLPMLLHMTGIHLPRIFTFENNDKGVALTQFLLCQFTVINSYDYFVRGFRNLVRLMPNMDSLIAVGTGASFLYSVWGFIQIEFLGNSADLYFESTSVILTLVTLGKYMEALSKKKTNDAIQSLSSLVPETAAVEHGGTETYIPTAELNPGDIVIMRPGERFPCDGILISGSSSADESMLTGESLPVSKAEGDKISCGSINLDGYIKFKATEVGTNTSLAKIIRLVEDAGGKRAPVARLADKISGIFVPVVIGIAAFTFSVWLFSGAGLSTAIETSVCVLVIACPCALGLATPAAIMVGTGKGARYGILFKSGEAIEHMSGVDTVVFDKTGTLTTGILSVTEVIITGGLGELELLQLVASVEKGSRHPAAGAVIAYAEKKGIEPSEVADFENHSGLGVSGRVGGRVIAAGNRRFMEQCGIDLPERLSGTGTEIFVAADKKAEGIIICSDTLRPEAAGAVQKLRTAGLSQYMLTGDNRVAAELAAASAGLGAENVHASLLPAGKADFIAKLRGRDHKVAMVGDGINDAPSLTISDVGISFGSGTDIAVESADIILPAGDVSGVYRTYILSCYIMRKIRQNLFFAFIYNIIGIPVAAGVLSLLGGPFLSPMTGALAMSFSSVSVLINSLSINRYKF